jgi:NADH-quinone oxidoreductase subunit E
MTNAAPKKTDDRDAPEGDAMPSQQMAAMMTLMAQPMVGMAAMSAFGITLSTQAFGLWLGALSRRAAISRATEGASQGRKDETGPVPSRQSATVTKLSDVAPIRRAVPRAAPAAKRQTAALAVPANVAMRRPKAVAKPVVVDDLKAISGVGPKLEQVLNDLGIWTFAQVANWSEAEIAWVDDRLGFGGRIGRDDWIEQAGELARTRQKA